MTGNVLHQTLQQILKLVSFYTATDPETSCLFASRLIATVCCTQPAKTLIRRCFSLSTPFTSYGIHAAVYSLKCFRGVVWCMVALFWPKIRSITLLTFAAKRAVLVVSLYHSRLDPSWFSLIRFKKLSRIVLHLFCGKLTSSLFTS